MLHDDRQRRQTGLTALFAAVIGLSCGADTTAATGVSTGLPSQQRLSSFDDADAKTACEALNEGATTIISDRELIRSQCAALAIRTSAKLDREAAQFTLDVASCERAARDCEAKPTTFGITAEGGRDQDDCDKARANAQVQACEATVSEYEACVSQVLSEAKRTLANVSCANGRALLENDGRETKLDPGSITACEPFLSKCPDVQITAVVGE